MNGPYNIPNLENQGKEVGTINQPFFYQITSGQKHGKSLIYHAQIRKRYYRYTFKSCSSENLHLGCKDRSCKAVAFCKIPISSCLIVEKPTKRSNGKRLVKQYTLKFDDPRLRDFDNSTNFVESLNFVLKKFVPRGTVSFKKACETIFRFKIYEISQKHQAMKNGGMRRQGPETIRKREAILTIIQMLENSDLNDPKTLVNFALKFSHYNPSFNLY